MPDDKSDPFKLPSETFIDKAGTFLGGTIIALTGLTFGALMLLGLNGIGDWAFLAFGLALISTLVRHMIRIDRSEESDNYEEISLKNRWYFKVPKRLPPAQPGNPPERR